MPSRAILIFGVAIAAVACSPRPAETPPEAAPSETVSQSVEAVAALGQLEPEGDFRRLDGPSASRAISPRISELLVDEGEMVTRGQVLARFDNRAGLQADLDELDAQMSSLMEEFTMQELEVLKVLHQFWKHPVNDNRNGNKIVTQMNDEK